MTRDVASSDSVLACDQALVVSSVVILVTLEPLAAGVTKLVSRMTTAAMTINSTVVSTDAIMYSN